MGTGRRTTLQSTVTVITGAVLMMNSSALSGETSSWIQTISPVNKAAKPARKPKKVKSRIEPAAAGNGGTPAVAPAPTGQAGDADPAYAAYDSGHYLTALERAKAAAGNGDPAGHTLVGRILAEGLGVPRDKAKAATWYAKGVELGDENAAFALGVLYANGTGVSKDPKKAAGLFAVAAQKGHVGATYNLALAYLSGSGRTQDVTGGAKLMLSAAQADERNAQYDLGALYALGQGFKQDETQAAFWTGKAAAAGLVRAQLDYAIMLFKGRGVEKDIDRAVWFFRAAAERGNPVAQNRLATLYAYGVGIKQSRIEAAKWHLLARSRGVSDFKLDIVISKLSSENQTEVARKVAEWADRTLLAE